MRHGSQVSPRNDRKRSSFEKQLQGETKGWCQACEFKRAPDVNPSSTEATHMANNFGKMAPGVCNESD
jgi:hypothetical protein